MPLSKALLTAGAAAALAALLLGGTATYASWSDSTDSGTTTTIAAGELTAEITQTGPKSVQYGTEATGIYPTAGSEGIIPGIQDQRWTYTLTNTSDSSVAAEATLRLRGEPVTHAGYSNFLGSLHGVVIVDSHEIDIPASAFTEVGLSYDVDLGIRLNPGESSTVEFSLRVPQIGWSRSWGITRDLAEGLQNTRSQSVAALPFFAMTNRVFLEQAGTR